jgi:hypothetical protein
MEYTMNFFEATFMSRMTESVQLTSGKQVYKAQDLEDAMKQHDRATAIMQTVHEEYECNLVVMAEVESKSKIKRLNSQWRK